MRNIILFWRKNEKTISVVSWMGRPLETQIIITPMEMKLHHNTGVNVLVPEEREMLEETMMSKGDPFEEDMVGMGAPQHKESIYGQGLFDDDESEDEEVADIHVARPNVLLRQKAVEEPVKRREQVAQVKAPRKVDDPFDEYHICFSDIKWSLDVLAMLPQSLTQSAHAGEVISFVPVNAKWFLKNLPLCTNKTHRVYKPPKILRALSELPPLNHTNKAAAQKYMESQTAFDKAMRRIANENLPYAGSCHIKVNEASTVFHYHIHPGVFFDVPMWLDELDKHPIIQHSFMWVRNPSEGGEFLISSSDKGNWDLGLLNGVWNVTKKMMPMGLCIIMTFSKNPSNYYMVLIDRMRFVVYQGNSCRWYTTSERHERTYYNFMLGQIFKTLQQIAETSKITTLRKYIEAIISTYTFKKQEFKYTIGAPLATIGFKKDVIESVLDKLIDGEYIISWKHKLTERGTFTYQLEIIGVLITKSMLNHCNRTSSNIFDKLRLSYKDGMSGLFIKKLVTLTVNSTHAQIKGKFTGTQEPGMLAQVYAKFLDIVFKHHAEIINPNPTDSSIAAIDNTDPATYDDDDSYKYPLTCQHDRQPIFLIEPQYKMLSNKARMRTKKMLNPETGKTYYVLLKEKYPHPNPMFMSKYGMPVLCCRQTIKVNTVARMPIATVGDAEAEAFVAKPLQHAHTNSKKKIRGPDRYYALNSNSLFRYFKDDIKCVAYGLDTISDVRETWVFSMLLVLVHMNPRMVIKDLIKRFNSLSAPLVFTINVLLKKNGLTLKDLEGHTDTIANFGLNRRVGKILSEIIFLATYEMWNVIPICFSEDDILNINFFHMNALHAVLNNDHVGKFQLVFIEIPANNPSTPGLLTYAVRQTVPAFDMYGHLDLSILYNNLIKSISDPTKVTHDLLADLGYEVEGSYVIEYLYVYGFKVRTPRGTSGYFPVDDHVAVNNRVLINELPEEKDLLTLEELTHIWKGFKFDKPEYLLLDEDMRCIGWFKDRNYFIQPCDMERVPFKDLKGMINTCFQKPKIKDAIAHAQPDYDLYIHQSMFKYYFTRAVYMVVCEHMDKETRDMIKHNHKINNYGRQLTKVISEVDFKNITNMIMTGTFETNFDSTLFTFDIIHGLRWLHAHEFDDKKRIIAGKMKKISFSPDFKEGYDPTQMDKCIRSFDVVYNMPLYYDMLWRINTTVMPQLPLLPTVIF